MSSSVTSIALLQKRVAEMLPSLSKAAAIVLGYLSYGMVMLNGCGMSRLSNGLAKIEQVPAGRLRQRLREFYYEAEAKRGNKRREVNVQACFADLLRCVLRGWQGKKELALAMDASTLGERFTVLSISVMYRGCRIPIAWKIIEAMEEGAWRPHWEGLLATLEGVVPADWKVILMADRGLYAAWLYQAIQRRGWHPMLRVKENLSFRATGEENFSPMGMRVKRRGRGWSGKGEWSEVRPKRRVIFCCARAQPHSGGVSKAAPYFGTERFRGTVAWERQSPLKSQYQGPDDGQLGRPWSRQNCLNSSRGGTHSSCGNGIIAHI